MMPIGADAAGDPGKNVTGQMGNPHPGQDKEPHIVCHKLEIVFALGWCPPDEGIPRRGFPCCGAKQKARQWPPLRIMDKIFEVFPDRTSVPQVMIL